MKSRKHVLASRAVVEDYHNNNQPELNEKRWRGWQGLSGVQDYFHAHPVTSKQNPSAWKRTDQWKKPRQNLQSCKQQGEGS